MREEIVRDLMKPCKKCGKGGLFLDKESSEIFCSGCENRFPAKKKRGPRINPLYGLPIMITEAEECRERDDSNAKVLRIQLRGEALKELKAHVKQMVKHNFIEYISSDNDPKSYSVLKVLALDLHPSFDMHFMLLCEETIINVGLKGEITVKRHECYLHLTVPLGSISSVVPYLKSRRWYKSKFCSGQINKKHFSIITKIVNDCSYDLMDLLENKVKEKSCQQAKK